ncbi:hypothetical protein Ddye_018435 [Dipteronia dyeriana]|uniref:Uncharacterized protein n=1 Tax=Dipteronia dyeriana TaxID=168575 RepID=A0AAD9UB18_9ROSI|nr:hypothetical protein Ddye_018435 [Dipteronia dyeriana]
MKNNNVSRNNSSNKFLVCFKPVVDMDQLVLESKSSVVNIDHHGSRSQRRLPFNCINPENRSENVKKSEKSMMVRCPSNKTVSKVIKAVLFETILAKRVRDRKSERKSSTLQDSYHHHQSSKRSFSNSRRTHKSLDSSDHYVQQIKSIPVLSSQSSVNSSSSSSSSSSCCSISEPKKQNQNCKQLDNNNNNNMVGGGSTTAGTGSWSFSCVITLLLIIILTVTCLCGRVSAIFCTTVSLYYLPRRSKCRRWRRLLPENEAMIERHLRKKSEGSGEYQKKKIIMEGLLERNHHSTALNT